MKAININEKLATIQTKLKSKKSRYNSFGDYNYRSAEDILEATKPFLLELGVTVTLNENLIASDPIPIIESQATISDGNETIKATALVGVDLMQKGMQTPQKFGSASSYGKKYALGNLFLIDDTYDSDALNQVHNAKTNPAKIETPSDADLLTRIKAHHDKGETLEEIYNKMIDKYPELKGSMRLTKIKKDYDEKINSNKPSRKTKK
tara:strand:+ start:432 stop:1052 length:621 start_codon:yes stop_codon:yes gene_type:complete